MLRCRTFACTCRHTSYARSCYGAVGGYYGYIRLKNVNDLQNDHADDDGDDDDDEIAPDAKVSFFSVLWSPL